VETAKRHLTSKWLEEEEIIDSAFPGRNLQAFLRTRKPPRQKYIMQYLVFHLSIAIFLFRKSNG
jgi:hypothetical protein